MQLLNLRPNHKFLQFFLKTFHLDDRGTAISHSKLCVCGFWTVFGRWVFLPILFRAIFVVLLYGSNFAVFLISRLARICELNENHSSFVFTVMKIPAAFINSRINNL
jgi:hypothetical protein